jgi:hypothetical protein
MSATNRRVRRAILNILWQKGPLTKEDVAVALADAKGINHVPSPHSLSALLCKSASVVIVGKKKVENLIGQKASHALYDVDRDVVRDESELSFLLEPSTMTPKEKAVAVKCPSCSRTRILPPEHTECLRCSRMTSL